MSWERVLSVLVLWVALWFATIAMLYRVAEPFGDASVTAILGYNAPGLVLSLVAALAGAQAGQLLASRRKDMA